MKEGGDWFESWFDSKYYHLLYRDRDYSEAERFVQKLGDHLNLNNQDYVLDLACGKGRHSLNLGHFGAKVLGLDLSQASINEANYNAHERLSFGVHDMRNPIEQGPFSLLVNLFTSFGYFENEDENLVSIQNMSNALQENGRMVLDFMNTKKVVRDLIEAEIKTVDHIKFVISREISNGWIVKKIRFKDEGQDFKFEERVRVIQKEDFELYFAKSGLILEEVYGDYDLNSFDVNQSSRMIFKLRK